MLHYLVYFLIAIGATTAGAITGMGGGVIIKPLLDILGDYDVSTIGLLSSMAVFTMSSVSIGKQISQKIRIRYPIAIPIALGSVAGGFIGQKLLEIVVNGIPANGMIVIMQNAILGLLILGVFIYMRYKDRVRTLGLSGLFPSVLTGIILGILSSFLGIGGGPFNVAIIMFMFSFDIKTATVCSIITILFAQVSKLVSVALTTGFHGFDLSTLPFILVGAVAGGYIGTVINKAVPDSKVELCFNGVQVLVLAIAVLNIVNNII